MQNCCPAGVGPVRGRAARSLLAAAILLAAASAFAQPPLNRDIQALIRAAEFGPGEVGVAAIDVASGRILTSIGDERPMIPASNQKLLTTGAALLLLGQEFTFATTVYADRPPVDETLYGDLIVVAGGDPCIGGRGGDDDPVAKFDALAAEIAQSITTVRGDLIIDATIFDGEHIHPAWPKDQLLRSYCAPVSALALNENCVFVRVRPAARVGQPAVVFSQPQTSHVTIQNRCTTVQTGTGRAHITRLPQSDTIVVSGELTPASAGASANVPVLEPLKYAATVLRERLEQAGVQIEGEITFAEEPTDLRLAQRLARVESPLTDAISVANKVSSNFHAEMIFKTLGRTVRTPSSFEAGAEAVAAAFDRVGIPEGGWKIDDGSGLSRNNRISPFHLTCFLRYLALSDHRQAYIDSLAIAGVDGTLRRRMTQEPYKGSIYAKTGHIRGVSALSGYARAGERLVAFSIIVNSPRTPEGRRLQDRICRALVDSSQ